MFKQYFYSRETLELMADDINRKYYPERLDSVLPLDPYDLLEKQGLDVEWKYISPNEQLLGLIFFADEKFPVWDKGTFQKGDEPHYELFKKGTIVINNILVEKKKYKKKEIFVCTHENCHWIKDQEYFKDHPESIIQICDSKSLEKTYWNSKMSDRDIIERQNNYLCAAVIMPRDVIKKAFFKSMRYKNIPEEPIELKPFMKKHIAVLASMYGINYNPVLYRLYDLNMHHNKLPDISHTKGTAYILKDKNGVFHQLRIYDYSGHPVVDIDYGVHKQFGDKPTLHIHYWKGSRYHGDPNTTRLFNGKDYKKYEKYLKGVIKDEWINR